MAYVDPVEYYLRQQERRDNQIRNILSTFLTARQYKNEQEWKQKEYDLTKQKLDESLRQQEIENQRQEREIKMREPYYQSLTEEAKTRANRTERSTPLTESQWKIAVAAQLYPDDLKKQADFVAGKKTLDEIRAEAETTAEARAAATERHREPPQPKETVADKLRTIQQMLKDGLMSPDEYKYASLAARGIRLPTQTDTIEGLAEKIGATSSEPPNVSGVDEAKKQIVINPIPTDAPQDVKDFMKIHRDKTFKESMAIYQKALKNSGK